MLWDFHIITMQWVLILWRKKQEKLLFLLHYMIWILPFNVRSEVGRDHYDPWFCIPHTIRKRILFPRALVIAIGLCLFFTPPFLCVFCWISRFGYSHNHNRFVKCIDPVFVLDSTKLQICQIGHEKKWKDEYYTFPNMIAHVSNIVFIKLKKASLFSLKFYFSFTQALH